MKSVAKCSRKSKEEAEHEEKTNLLRPFSRIAERSRLFGGTMTGETWIFYYDSETRCCSLQQRNSTFKTSRYANFKIIAENYAIFSKRNCPSVKRCFFPSHKTAVE
jgi:hypothetical protein